jgi:predicted TIM-barrel fold metal-dependent hydrolase
MYPDRFMIGSDTHYPDESRYDDVMKEFRDGLFPYLQPETLKKVAYQNAVKVFRLAD